MNKQALTYITSMLDEAKEPVQVCDEHHDEYRNVELNAGFDPCQPYEIYIKNGVIKHRNIDLR